MTKEEIMQAIESMTVLELSELVKAMEERFGVSAAAPVAVAAAAGPAAAAEPEEEKTEFDVVLAAVGDKKINVIKPVSVLKRLRLSSTAHPLPSKKKSRKLMPKLSKPNSKKSAQLSKSNNQRYEIFSDAFKPNVSF